MENNQNNYKVLFFVLLGIILLSIIGVAGYFIVINWQKEKAVGCTFDAKICPDGSSVGRVPPKCEFSPCPSSSPPSVNEKSQWKSYINTKYGYSIDYPSDWTVREFTDTKTGAAFQNETIVIDVSRKVMSDKPISSFEEYAKVAATLEIQSYNKLASFEKITTKDGVVGYKTTWIVGSPPIINAPNVKATTSESNPITYFEIPNNTNYTVQLRLNNNESLETYNEMLKTFRFTSSTNNVSQQCVDYQGNPQDPQACSSLLPKEISCSADSDCKPTCGSGCVTKFFNKIDCAAIPEYKCECVFNTCVKKIKLEWDIEQNQTDQLNTNIEGKFCGGIAANLPQNQCPAGYTCKLDGNYPDAGGTCQKIVK